VCLDSGVSSLVRHAPIHAFKKLNIQLVCCPEGHTFSGRAQKSMQSYCFFLTWPNFLAKKCTLRPIFCKIPAYLRKKQHFCFVFRMPVTRKKLSRGFSNDRISRPQQIDRSHKHNTRRFQLQWNSLFYKPLIIHNLFFYFFNRSYKTARIPMIFNPKLPRFSVLSLTNPLQRYCFFLTWPNIFAFFCIFRPLLAFLSFFFAPAMRPAEEENQ